MTKSAFFSDALCIGKTAQHSHKNAQQSFELTFSLLCTGSSFTEGVIVGIVPGTFGGLVLGLVFGMIIGARIVWSSRKRKQRKQKTSSVKQKQSSV